MSEETLERNVKTRGINAPYVLADARLTIDFEEVTPSGINGARKFDLTVTYALPDIIGGISIDNITLTYEREVYVLA